MRRNLMAAELDKVSQGKCFDSTSACSKEKLEPHLGDTVCWLYILFVNCRGEEKSDVLWCYAKSRLALSVKTRENHLRATYRSLCLWDI